MRQEQCVIIGGATIRNYDRIRSYLGNNDFYIFCDSGLKHQERLHLTPHLIVGDFDSWENPGLPVETITLPREKDDTDTIYAIKEAIRRGFETFLLIGAAGDRLDHTLVNVYALLMLDSAGKKARLIDDYSEMELVSRNPACIPDYFPYFSLLNISGTAKGITIKNARFPLTDGEITSEYQYATSNEVLPGETAVVTVKEGHLLLIKCFPRK
ncbi:MAG: thiamine diphosphokinase [Lachnospiraceae bacterium]|nr:thiamine diphosphokinase [Lachnospiraceae bacterium]MBR1854384.1 thiamine diphosphokinase [Lachnospiraceae bacterium]